MSFAALLAAAVAVVAGEDGGGGVGVAGLGVETSSLCYGWALIFSCAPPPPFPSSTSTANDTIDK